MKDYILKYWINYLFGIIVTALGVALKKQKKDYQLEKATNEAMKNGVKALLRAEIIATYNHYSTTRVLPIYARENLHELFKEYTALGGNGAIKDLMESMCEWETKQGGE